MKYPSLEEQKASIKISETSQFHKNMMACLQDWFPDQDDEHNHHILLDIYPLVPYNPTKVPTKYQNQAIQKYLVMYRVAGL